MKISHLKIIATDIERIIAEYISGEIPEKKFFKQYPEVLQQFEEMAEDGVYWPLDLLVPADSNSERAWKESVIAMQKQQIQELESTLDDDEESYTEKLSTSERKALCKDGIKMLRMQVQDITFKAWINDNLVDGVEFDFLSSTGESKFGTYKTLYSTPILQESFLLTALSNVLVKPSFSFPQLLGAARKASNDSKCFWAHCSEDDGAIANIKVESTFEGNAYDQIDQLGWIEHTTGVDTQWGDCHLLLIPFDYCWLVKITNNFKELKIELHGDSAFLSAVTDIIDEHIHKNA